jgi:octaprenyl-diphosphate synthase
MYAGASAGGLTAGECLSLERFGEHLGLAFQAIDDVLDIAGDAALTGKTPFADLREGKASLPIVLALRLRPELEAGLRAAADGVLGEAPTARLAKEITATGALDEARRFADEQITFAIAILDAFEPSPARGALVGIAHAMTHREV